MEVLKAQNFDTGLFALADEELSNAVMNKDRTFHYLPYDLDLSFEMTFIAHALTSDTLLRRKLEVYYNGEGELTEFRINCFGRTSNGWARIGKYTPDFLLVERKSGAIYRALIVETKGQVYARDFATRRRFIETEWLKINNEKFGYRRFDFLYLEGEMNAAARFSLDQRVTEFFTD